MARNGASVARERMQGQPRELRDLLDDRGPVEQLAARLQPDRPVALVGTGTSWHCANQGAWMLHAAGVPARALTAIDAVAHGALGPDEQVLLLTNLGSQRYVRGVERSSRLAGRLWGKVSALGVSGADVTTVSTESSACVTAGHLAALMRMAQLAVALGAPLAGLEEVPAAVGEALAAPRRPLDLPPRSLEMAGTGINQWTAAEGALKVREAARILSNGFDAEYLLHGPIAALDERDALVVLDGGDPTSERLGEIAATAARAGVRVHYLREDDLGALLSIFALTAACQRIAIECAEQLDVSPDTFGFENRRRWDAFAEIWQRL